jgi:hypothetical protein
MPCQANHHGAYEPTDDGTFGGPNAFAVGRAHGCSFRVPYVDPNKLTHGFAHASANGVSLGSAHVGSFRVPYVDPNKLTHGFAHASANGVSLGSAHVNPNDTGSDGVAEQRANNRANGSSFCSPHCSTDDSAFGDAHSVPNGAAHGSTECNADCWSYCGTECKPNGGAHRVTHGFAYQHPNNRSVGSAHVGADDGEPNRLSYGCANSCSKRVWHRLVHVCGAPLPDCVLARRLVPVRVRSVALHASSNDLVAHSNPNKRAHGLAHCVPNGTNGSAQCVTNDCSDGGTFAATHGKPNGNAHCQPNRSTDRNANGKPICSAQRRAKCRTECVPDKSTDCVTNRRPNTRAKRGAN